jgi:iron(III) transport system ATP-binding protein
MERYADRFPHQLSGGQQQRVALARTLAYEPSILLLDEPLSNLDAKLRERARTWLAQITKKVGLTTIYVTHDQSEALALSDRIAVMRDGRISQLGTPKAIYDNPADPFVADFIGSSNFLTGTAVSAGTAGEIAIRLDGGATVTALARHDLGEGSKVVAAIRPERILVHAGPGERRLEARVAERSYLGARTLYHLEIGSVTLRAESPLALEAASVFIEIPTEGCITFPVEDPAR